jgi:hypothetical protein
MAFQLYCTDYDISAAEYQANKSRLIPFVYSDGDDALRRAWQILGLSRVPWEIIGDDGGVIRRHEIPDEIWRRPAELARPPKVY